MYCLERRLFADEYTRAVEQYREAVLRMKSVRATDSYFWEKARVEELRLNCDVYRSKLEAHKAEHGCMFWHKLSSRAARIGDEIHTKMSTTQFVDNR